jgi:hypothetical protein
MNEVAFLNRLQDCKWSTAEKAMVLEFHDPNDIIDERRDFSYI